MGNRRRLALLGLAAASLVLATGSGAFSATSADRGVEVSVVEDDKAYLALGDSLQCGAGSGNQNNRNIVQNQFAETTIEHLVLTVSVPPEESGEIRIGKTGDTTQIGPGDSTTLTFENIEPGEGATVQVRPPTGNVDSVERVGITVNKAVGDGVDATLMKRNVVVNCSSGGGNKGGNTGENSNDDSGTDESG